MVGKYVTLMDSYVSVNLALKHAAAANGVGVDIKWIESEDFEGTSRVDKARKVLDGADAIVLPQGYGKRGTEGKIWTADYARRDEEAAAGPLLRLPALDSLFREERPRAEGGELDGARPADPRPGDRPPP